MLAMFKKFVFCNADRLAGLSNQSYRLCRMFFYNIDNTLKFENTNIFSKFI